MTEAELQAVVIEAAQLFGWLVHHVKPARTPDGKYLTRIQGDAGFPDLCLARDGHIILVELKSETGRLSDAQNDWLTKLNPFGGSMFQYLDEYGGRVMVDVWRPSDWLDGTITETLR